MYTDPLIYGREGSFIHVRGCISIVSLLSPYRFVRLYEAWSGDTLWAIIKNWMCLRLWDRRPLRKRRKNWRSNRSAMPRKGRSTWQVTYRSSISTALTSVSCYFISFHLYLYQWQINRLYITGRSITTFCASDSVCILTLCALQNLVHHYYCTLTAQFYVNTELCLLQKTFHVLPARSWISSFLPERHYTLLSGTCYRKSACRLSVCNVRTPYSAAWHFRQYFFAILYPSHPLISAQNFMEIVPGNPSIGVKRYWGSQI